MIKESCEKFYTDPMEQPLYSPVSPQVINYDMNNYYSGQAFITPVSPYEARPEYERESVFSELRVVDSIIDSTVSVLRQFDTLTSNTTTTTPHRQSTGSVSSVSDTYSMTSTDSVTSACAYVPPPQVMDMSMSARGSPSPSSPLAPTTPSSLSSFDDLAPAQRKRNPYNKTKKKYIARGTKEYCEKRERNNVAVRKSRAKAKNRQRDNERRMCELQIENERLTEKLEGISKELVVLKGLFKNMGAAVPAGFSKLFQS